MGKMLIGNFKGPKGEKGNDGTDGRRGSRWTLGTAVTGTSTTPAVFSGTGITDALTDDVYMNTETGNIYRCTLSGNAQTAQWAYTGSLKGPTGATGSPGATGATGAVDANTQIEFSDIGTYVEMQSGNSIATLFSKIKKGLADLFSGKLDKTKVIASTNITEPGFLMDGKTVADAFSQLNSNLWKNIILIEETVAMNSDATVFGGYYGYIELTDNEYAKKAKLIIPIGAVRSNTTTNGYGAYLAPTYKSYIDLACKRWVVCAGTAGEYTAGFICIW